MHINKQQLPPTNWRVLQDWDRPTYWESLRGRQKLYADAGSLSETDRAEYERKLATEGMVSYQIDKEGRFTYESTLDDKVLALGIALDMRDYDQRGIWCLESQAQIKLQQIQDKFGDFKDQLAISNPELATKRFGFAINELGNLEATSTEELNDQEREQLNGWLNGFDDLKEMTLGHADYIVALCKVDNGMRPKNGGGVHKTHSDLTQYAEFITLKNIGKFIDYGLLLHNPNSKPGSGYCWREQLEANGDKILEEMAAAKAKAKAKAEAEAKNAPVD